MEALRKRRASSEVQELMNAVKNDYEFFERFDSSFHNAPTTKRQRSASDNVFVQYAVVRPKPRHLSEENQLSKPSHGKYSDKNARFNEYNSLPELIKVAPKGQHRSGEQLQRSREQLKISREQDIPPRERLEYARAQEQMFRKITPDFWASHGDEKFISGSTYTCKTTAIGCRPNSNQDSLSQVPTPREFICLSSEPFTSRGVDAIAGRKRTMLQRPKPNLPALIESQDEPPFLIRFDADTARRVSENEATSPEVTQGTTISLGGFPINQPLVYSTPGKIRRLSVEREQEIVNVEKIASPTKRMPSSDSDDEIIVVDTTPSPSPSQSSNSGTSANKKAENNHVTSSQTNEKPDESKEVLLLERKSSDGGSPLSLSLSDQIWPDYVITRVGSLLWLDKEVVYPITLDEMRRRIQDPENFSFQMLIAYVRHSRAKGRQFLDYWKCQPSGRTSRPNVLSKLCEADAKELVRGIESVHEEYFPHEALAKNVAANIVQVHQNRLTANEEEGKKAKEFIVQEKVKAIQKSR
jgi:hypothetical protein